jgi:hypothetical protein
VTSDVAKRGGGGGYAATVFAKTEDCQALTMIFVLTDPCKELSAR